MLYIKKTTPDNNSTKIPLSAVSVYCRCEKCKAELKMPFYELCEIIGQYPDFDADSGTLICEECAAMGGKAND